MKTLLRRRIVTPLAVAVLAHIGTIHTPQAVADSGVTFRPIQEWVDAQGTFCLGEPPNCFLFVPPVPNFLGLNDPQSELGMSVDYAGLADLACGGIAGTTFAGTVREKVLPDGRAEVTVELLTTNAIAWVIDLPIPPPQANPFGEAPVLFGVRWEDDDGDCVLDGAPALANSQLKVTFIISAPGAPLPDLLPVLFFTDDVLAISFHAEAVGELPDGTPAIAEVHQVAKVKNGVLTFFVEHVFIEPLDP